VRTPPPSVTAFAAAAVAVPLAVWFAGRPEAPHALEMAGLLVAAILASTVAGRSSSARDLDTMRPSFVIDFATLVLLGLPASMAVGASGEIARGLGRGGGWGGAGRTLAAIATSLAALQAAGAVHAALGGTLRHARGLWDAVPLAGAVAAYCVVRVTVAGFVVPVVTRKPVDPAWSARLPLILPPYVVGASLAVGLAEAVARGAWGLLAVAILPMYVAHRAYCGHLHALDEARHRHDVLDAIQGMAVINGSGEVTLWSDAVERLLGCSRERAVGRSLFAAVPALTGTELERAIGEAAKAPGSRATVRITVPTVTTARILDVQILPVDGGATLLWQNVTEQTRRDSAVRRTEERLSLAAEAANDGLWDWDLRSQQCFFSGRWRAMLGLPARAGSGSADEWLARVHPEDLGAFKDALNAHLSGATERLQHELRLRHEDGSYRWFLCRGVAARGSGPRPTRIAGSLTEAAITRQRLGSAGLLDPLTGLANRTVFVERLGRRLADARVRTGTDRFAVLYLDLDRFKVVNDSLGHLVGDELLTAVSRRLESCLRPTDVLARLGGDEFAVLLNNLGDEQQANAIAFRLQEALSAPFSIDGREVFTTASIGIAIGLTDYASPDELMRDADTAMYHAKTRGKARHEMFDADMHARARDRLGLENDLRHAVANRDFEVHYQPIVALVSGTCVGFESLIRWKRNGEPVAPDKFIPLAEELGLIEPLGTWVLREACRTFAHWRRRYSGGLDYITVNVSSRQLVQQNFLSVVERAVHDAGLEPSELRLEITETALMDSPRTAAGLLRELRDFGVKIYLDDFGTGYSSLSHLHRLPVDALKIDRSFVNSLLLPDRPAIVESILALARTLNTSVVAEGIESAAQAHELERLGCTHAQGYLFSRPLSKESVEALLALSQPLGPKRSPVAGAGTGHEGPTSSGPFTWPERAPGRREPVDEPTPKLAGV
jgi:diguanylate cyclase (GGDEF)-like protein